ncbi:hypothetical protein RUND412_001711 [Rhizina undulata]
MDNEMSLPHVERHRDILMLDENSMVALVGSATCSSTTISLFDASVSAIAVFFGGESSLNENKLLFSKLGPKESEPSKNTAELLAVLMALEKSRDACNSILLADATRNYSSEGNSRGLGDGPAIISRIVVCLNSPQVYHLISSKVGGLWSKDNALINTSLLPEGGVLYEIGHQINNIMKDGLEVDFTLLEREEGEFCPANQLAEKGLMNMRIQGINIAGKWMNDISDKPAHQEKAVDKADPDLMPHASKVKFTYNVRGSTPGESKLPRIHTGNNDNGWIITRDKDGKPYMARWSGSLKPFGGSQRIKKFQHLYQER